MRAQRIEVEQAAIPRTKVRANPPIPTPAEDIADEAANRQNIARKRAEQAKLNRMRARTTALQTKLYQARNTGVRRTLRGKPCEGKLHARFGEGPQET